MLKRRTLVAVAASAVLVATTAPAGAATTWTPVASGTTQEISAVEYRSDTQAWFTTSGGQIYSTDAGGTFVQRRNVPGNAFTDVALSPSGMTGFAVTSNGTAYRSTDGGVSWNSFALPQVRDGCSALAGLRPIPRLTGVFWADDATAYLVGGTGGTEPIVIRVGSGVARDANWTGSECLLGTPGRPVVDGVAVPGNPDALRFITAWFGGVYQTNDGLTTTAALTGEMINNSDGTPRIALDPDNPNRIWAVDRGCGSLCFVYSEDGGVTYPAMEIVGSASGIERDLYSVAYAGGTLVAVGDRGEIYTSINGKQAYLQRAGGALDATNWRAVDTADATHALVGGAGGALVRSTNANAIPDTTAPTATLSGPASLAVGQTGTFTAAVADEAGGSGLDPASLAWTSPGTADASGTTATFTFLTPGVHTITLSFRDLAGNAATAAIGVLVTDAVIPPPRRTTPRTGGGGGRGGDPTGTPPNATRETSQTTGGARLTLWKRIALSRGRYVPVRVSARDARRFVIEIRRGRRPHTRIAMSKVRLARRGTKLVRVPLRRTVRTGKYRVVVRVYKGRRSIGRTVTVAFVISR